MISGHVTICKVYSDGTKETVLDKANLVTAGLGSSFIDLIQNNGSKYSDDYSPRYFQVGTSDIGYTTTPARQASSTFYQVSAPFHFSAYGTDTTLIISKRYRGFHASTLDPPAVSLPHRTYVELLNTSAPLSSCIFSGTDQYFAEISDSKLSKYFMDSFDCEIVLDEQTGNGKDITEIGLFSKNPKGFQEDSPLLIAYKNFTAIPKSSEFSLMISWSVGFLGISTTVDDYYTGSDQIKGAPLFGGGEGQEYYSR